MGFRSGPMSLVRIGFHLSASPPIFWRESLAAFGGFGTVLAASWPILENPEGPSASYRGVEILRYRSRAASRFSAGEARRCRRPVVQPSNLTWQTSRS